MGEFRDHPTKVLIREKWCKPLLNHIYKKLDCEFVYMGLPAIDALDILSWIDFLKKVIVFQCREYGQPSLPGQSKDGILKLEALLNDLETKGSIDTYSLFDGYIEEVVLNGRDNSGNDFTQNDVVTVYNLDFCNALTSPLNVWNAKKLDYEKMYKVEAIRKLLELQRDISLPEHNKKFIMFLTVHSKFWESEASKLLKIDDSSTLLKYKENVINSNLPEQEINLRLLKLFVFQCLKHHFCDCRFTPYFFPPIYFKGVGKNNWLVCFTITGTYFSGSCPTGIAPHFQEMSEILRNKFLFADEKKITCIDNKNIDEISIESHPIKLFSEVHSYKSF